MNRFLVLSSLFVGLVTAGANAQNVGPAVIGLTAFTQADATRLADIIGDERKDTDLAFLPFEFQNSDRGPFDRARETIRAALPRLDSDDTFRITIYLHWADNHQLTWSDFRGNGNNGTKSRMMTRAAETGNFIAGLRAWNAGRIASGGRRGGQLKFTIVPMLEDNCTNASDYSRCLALVRSAVENAGASPSAVSYRRSVAFDTTGNGSSSRVASGSLNRLFRVEGAALEVHGNADSVTAINASGRVRMERGDTLTNDGTRMSLSDFNSLRSRLAAQGISALYWSQAYNGDRTLDRRERVLRPFTGPQRAQEDADLRAAM